MTLVTRLKPPAYHKKTIGKHHRHSKKYNKTYWPYIPLLLIVGLGLILNSVLPGAKAGVLGYATEMSVQSLLDNTNSQRQSNGIGALAVNQLLNNAAQAKAQDMANRNYWSHNTPDNQPPWVFMTAAGYNYQYAGENLAYGYSTSAATLVAWMNSPGHRANILNSNYKEVGFGFINIPDYISKGPATLVVAMYGSLPPVVQNITNTVNQLAKPAATAPTVQPASPATDKPATTPAPATTPTTTPAADTTPATTPTTTETQSTPANSDTVTPAQTTPIDNKTAQVVEPESQDTNRLNLLTASNVGWSSATLTIIGLVALIVVFLRHSIAWHKILVKGEHFVLRHPLLDVALVVVVTAVFVLARQVGTIR